MEFINGRRTDVRKCVKCGEKLKCLNYFTEVLEVVRKRVNFKLGKQKIMDKQLELEKTAELLQLHIIKEKATRWNSLFSMLEQLLKPKIVIPLLLLSTELLPADFGWRKLGKVCNILKPLQELPCYCKLKMLASQWLSKLSNF